MGWLTGWTYRKSITLSRASGAVTDYQMKVLVGESPGTSLVLLGCDTKVVWTTNNSSVSVVAGYDGNCIKISGTGADAQAYFDVGGQSELSAARGIKFWHKRDGSAETAGEVFIFSGTGFTNFVKYNFTMVSDWTQETILFSDTPDGSGGTIDWGNITAIRFDANYNGTNLYIDKIEYVLVDCGGNCKSDFNDIRFTTSDGETLLDYWIEYTTGTTPNQYAQIWVEFDSIGTSDTTFYLYYGNSGASAYSSGSDTFSIFDDFEWGSDEDDLTTSGGSVTWTSVQGAANIDTAKYWGGSRSARFSGAATYPIYTIPFAHSATVGLRLRFYKEAAVDNGPNLSQGDGTNRWNVSFNNTGLLWYYGETPTSSTVNCTQDAWQLLEIREIDHAAQTFDIVLNGVKVVDGASGMYTNGSFNDLLRVLIGDTTAGRDFWIDNIFVRHYRAVEPVWGSWGSEEEAATSASANDSYHEHTVGNVALTQSHSLSVAGAYHANVAEAIVLTQDLTVASAYHEHDSDNLVLVQSLGLNSAYHDFVSEDVVLTQDHTLVIQSTYNENVSATVSLSQEHDLVVGSTYHALVSDNAVLTGVHGLAVAGAVNLNVAGDIALTQEHALSIADSYHVLASDNVATVQIFTLAIAGAYSLNVAGEPVLNINFNTVAADGEHLHTAENVVLTQEHNLYVSDCASIIVTGVVALTQKHTLSADSAFHTNSGDNISLSQYHDIVVGNTYHEQAVGEISLTQENNIDVADTYHALVSDNITLSQINRLKVDHCYHSLFSDNIVFAALPLLERTWVESAGRCRTIHSATRKTFIESASEYRRMAA